ncbi:MAG: hypothetical protein AAB675_01525 [Patescibacteria group bacterium]
MQPLEARNTNIEMHPERRVAEIAKDFFIEASIGNPFSLVGQAARIATRCRYLGVRPDFLGTDLLSQPDLISEIQIKGTEIHSGRNIKPIGVGQLRDTIEIDFAFAQELLILDAAELEKLYTRFENTPPSPQKEAELLGEAQKAIAYAKLRLNYIREDKETF